MAELKQRLGYWTILALCISAIMGTTMYFGAAIGARYGGNMVLVAWVLLSAVALYIAAVFGELAAMFPKAGGAYEFSKQAYGRFPSFMIGWTTWLVGNIAVVLLVVSAANVLLEPGSIQAIAASIAIILALNAMAYVGLKIASVVLVTFAITMVAMIAALIARGAFFVDFSHFTPLLTHPFSSVLVIMFFLAETYFGWEAATFLAEETINPKKVIPKALLHGTAIIAVLGFLLFAVILGVIPWQGIIALNPTDSLQQVSAIIFGSHGSAVIAWILVVTFVGSAVASAITLPRLLLALARDKLFLGQFRKIHARFHTPSRAVLFQTAALLVILFLAWGRYEMLLSLLVPMALVMYILLILAVPVLRFKQPATERPFRVLWGKTGPLLVAAVFLLSILGWLAAIGNALDTLLLSISLIALGLPLYLLVELYYDPKMITEANDLFAYGTLLSEKVSYPADIKRDILTFFGEVKGKTVLEYGCGVGTLTTHLLREVGPTGEVIATHFSGNHVRIARKRVERAAWETEGRVYGKVQFIHDAEQFQRVHPSITYADAAVSVGMLGHMQQLDRILKQLWDVLPLGGRICFIEYGDFFHVLPNVEWLGSDRAIEQRFRKAGFSVSVVRKKGLLWNKIFIYGIKSKEDVAFV